MQGFHYVWGLKKSKEERRACIAARLLWKRSPNGILFPAKRFALRLQACIAEPEKRWGNSLCQDAAPSKAGSAPHRKKRRRGRACPAWMHPGNNKPQRPLSVCCHVRCRVKGLCHKGFLCFDPLDSRECKKEKPPEVRNKRVKTSIAMLLRCHVRTGCCAEAFEGRAASQARTSCVCRHAMCSARRWRPGSILGAVK